jgi:hypothetical protein
MAHDVDVTCGVFHFEVPVIRRKPLVEDFRNLDPSLSEGDDTRRLFAAMSSVALDAERNHLCCHRLSLHHSRAAATHPLRLVIAPDHARAAKMPLSI